MLQKSQTTVSALNTVYIEEQELKCACKGDKCKGTLG